MDDQTVKTIRQANTFFERWNDGNVRIIIPRSHANLILHIWKQDVENKYLRIVGDPLRVCFNGLSWENCEFEISAEDGRITLLDQSADFKLVTPSLSFFEVDGHW